MQLARLARSHQLLSAFELKENEPGGIYSLYKKELNVSGKRTSILRCYYETDAVDRP